MKTWTEKAMMCMPHIVHKIGRYDCLLSPISMEGDSRVLRLQHRGGIVTKTKL